MKAESKATSLEEEYIATHPTLEKLYRRAEVVMPSGIEHDGRYMKPFPFYIARADKARKWDVDGNEYIDLCSAHGAYILGHNHPEVVAAVAEQVKKGFHYSSCHESEVELAEILTRLVPCAQKIRYMQSGTEANMLAIRVARAYTGKNKIIKFRGHFHGYWDEGMLGVKPPFDVGMSIGVPKGSLSNVLLANHNSSEDVRRLIEGSHNDVACVIMDPICHFCTQQNRPGFLEEVRQITAEKSVVLIYDEVVSGLRLAPGGAQQALGVVPDLATISKTMGGGLPASAVMGRREMMDVITFKDDPRKDRFQRVVSQGTHSANPVVFAAGLTTVKILSTGKPQAYINQLGSALRKRMNEVIQKQNIRGCAYGNWSLCRIFLGHDCPEIGKCDTAHCTYHDHEKIDDGTPKAIRNQLFLAMLQNGVDYMNGRQVMILNAAITEEDLDKITEAFDRSLTRLKRDKIL